MSTAGGRGQRNAAVDTKQCPRRRMTRKRIPDLKPTGEPCAVKVARTVRGRVVGKVLKGNSLATYPTPKSAAQFPHNCPLKVLVGCLAEYFRSGRFSGFTTEALALFHAAFRYLAVAVPPELHRYHEHGPGGRVVPLRSQRKWHFITQSRRNGTQKT